MRQLAHFDRADHAETLADVLYLEGIETRLDHPDKGGSILWVIDEQHMPQAREILSAFNVDPEAPPFQEAKRRATTERRAAEKLEKRRMKPVAVAERWQRADNGIGSITLILLGASTLVFMVTFPGVPETLGTSRDAILDWLLYERTPRPYEAVVGYFSDVRAGEVWRLVTPIFAHAEPRFTGPGGGLVAGLLGFAHFLFNMWWLRDLGSRIENQEGWLFFFFFALVAAVLSNTAQYVAGGGNFIGMSGVVYGVFGYVWLRSRADPAGAYALSSGTVSTLLLWMAFGFAGFMHMANWAHLGGLVVGAAWGFVGGRLTQRRS